MIEAYFNYIGAMVGTITVVPFMFMIAIAGPIILFKQLHYHQLSWLNKIKWPLAALTFLTSLFLFVCTGGFIGTQFGSESLGMGAGLVAFYYVYNRFTLSLPTTCQIE